MEILYLVLGILFGAVGVYFINKSKLNEVKENKKENEKLKNEIESLKIQLNETVQNERLAKQLGEKEKENHDNLKFDYHKLLDEKISLSENVSVYKTQNENLSKKLEEQKADLESIQKKFTQEFENIANRLFEKSSEKINKQGSEQLEIVLKPFKDRLFDLKSQISDTYEKDTQQRIRLHEQVKQLFELNQQISTDAKNLTNALKSNSKTQGDWGEEILENILQHSGLRKGFEYDTQQSYKTQEGTVQRPDMIVHYPDNRDMIIDSKVSLIAYERYVSVDALEKKEVFLKQHLDSIKMHIKELSDKNYQDLYPIKTLDFVMMFVPIEGAYYIAVEADRNLWQYAYEKKIILINPTNLITALKMISNLWLQDTQNKNVMEIARQSGALYDSFMSLLEDVIKMEKRIKDTQETYDKIYKRIGSSKGNLIGRVEKLKLLGAKTKKFLPEEFKDAIDQ